MRARHPRAHRSAATSLGGTVRGAEGAEDARVGRCRARMRAPDSAGRPAGANCAGLTRAPDARAGSGRGVLPAAHGGHRTVERRRMAVTGEGGSMTSIQPELWVEARARRSRSTPPRSARPSSISWATATTSSPNPASATRPSGSRQPRRPWKRLSPRMIDGATGRLLLVVDDPDTVAQQAVHAGAKELSPVGDEHGWRLGRIIDPFGHEWEIGDRPLAANISRRPGMRLPVRYLTDSGLAGRRL